MDKIRKILNWFLEKRIRAVIALILIAVVGFVLYSKSRGAATHELQTSAVERGNIVETVSASVTVLSSNFTPVVTSASGIITNVYVNQGDRVVRGQRIMQISLDSAGAGAHAQAYSSYLSAKNNLASANSTVYSLQSQSFAANSKLMNDAVARSLPEDDPTYIQEYADWKAAEAKYIQQTQVIAQVNASLNSSYLSYQDTSPYVLAPASGVISNFTFAPGVTLPQAGSSGTSGSTRVATIQSSGKPSGSFNVSEVDISKIRVGMKATITLDSISDKTFTGSVFAIDKVGTTSNGVTNYPIVIQFDTDSPDILPNMSATANIILDSKTNVLVVPSSAVTTQGTQSTVRKLVNGMPEIAPVEVGISSDTQVEITSGLSEGDEVVLGTISQNTSSGQSRSVFSTGGFGGGGNARFIAR